MDRFSLPLIALIFFALQVGATENIRDINIDNLLFGDLTLLEEGYFSGTSHHPFVQDLIAADDYYPWLVSQTHSLERSHDLPWETMTNSFGHLSIQDGWHKLSTVGRIGNLLHEARHTEGHAHTSCQQPPYLDTGINGCDENAAAGGAHAVEMEYYARVATQGSNFHPVFQKMARQMLLTRASFVFNESPSDILLARTPQGTIYIRGATSEFRDLKVGEDRRVYDANGLPWPALNGVEVLDLSIGPNLEVFD